MKQSSIACKLFIILALVLFTSHNTMNAQSTDPAVASVYMPLISVPISPVRINETETKRTRDGRFRLVGNIVNIANYPVYDVAIQVWLYDYLSQLLYTETRTTVLTATFPGQLNPFEFSTSYPDCFPGYPCVSYWEAAITGWSLNSDRTYRPATTTITDVSDIEWGTWVDVEVRNDGTEPLMDVEGVAWSLYQANFISLYPVAATLAPGETATFGEFLYMVSGGYTRTIRTAAQGYIAP